VAGGKCVTHLLLGDPLVIAIDDGVLDELVVVDHARKFLLGDKEIILALDFACAARAGGGGHHEMEGQAALFHALQDAILPRARGAGNDDQQWMRVVEVEFRLAHG
jgi:hypothetical protein